MAKKLIALILLLIVSAVTSKAQGPLITRLQLVDLTNYVKRVETNLTKSAVFFTNGLNLAQSGSQVLSNWARLGITNIVMVSGSTAGIGTNAGVLWITNVASSPDLSVTNALVKTNDFQPYTNAAGNRVTSATNLVAVEAAAELVVASNTLNALVRLADGSIIPTNKLLFTFGGESFTDTNGHAGSGPTAYYQYPRLLTAIHFPGLKGWNDYALSGQGYAQWTNNFRTNAAPWLTNNASAGDTVIHFMGIGANDGIQGWLTNLALQYIAARSNEIAILKNSGPAGVTNKVFAFTIPDRDVEMTDQEVEQRWCRFLYNEWVRTDSNINFRVDIDRALGSPSQAALWGDSIHPNQQSQYLIARAIKSELLAGGAPIPLLAWQREGSNIVARAQGTGRNLAQLNDNGNWRQVIVGRLPYVPSGSIPLVAMGLNSTLPAAMFSGAAGQTEAVFAVGSSAADTPFRVFAPGYFYADADGSRVNTSLKIYAGGDGGVLKLEGGATWHFNAYSDGSVRIWPVGYRDVTSPVLALLTNDFGGLVGVRTATPTNTLDVNGTFSVRGAGTNAAPVAAAVFDANGLLSRGAIPSGEVSTAQLNLAASNRVVVAAGTGGITVTPSGSGGILTFTVSDDDAGGSASTNNAGFSQVSSGQFTTNGNTLGLHPNVTNDLAAAMRAELVAAIATNGLATNYMTYSYLTNPIAMNTLWTNNTGYPVTLGIALHHTNSPSGTTVIYYTNHITGETFIDGYVPVVNVEAHIYKPLVVKVAAGQHISITNVKSGSIPGGSLIDGSIGIVEKITSRAVGPILEVAQVNTPELNATNLNAPTISNVFGILHAIQQPTITVSNILVSFATNSYELVGLTNVTVTNIVKLPTGVRGKTTIVVRNTLAVSVPILWPSFGSGASGIYWHTNGLNDAYFLAAAPPGTNTVIEIEQWGTNSFPGFTQWRHP